MTEKYLAPRAGNTDRSQVTTQTGLSVGCLYTCDFCYTSAMAEISNACDDFLECVENSFTANVPLTVCLSSFTAYIPPVGISTTHVAAPKVGVHPYPF